MPAYTKVFSHHIFHVLQHKTVFKPTLGLFASVDKFLLTFGNCVRWGHMLHLNTDCFFLGMEIFGELSTSGSSSKTGCGVAAGYGTSSVGSDWLSADSSLEQLSGTVLSGTLVKPVSSISSVV